MMHKYLKNKKEKVAIDWIKTLTDHVGHRVLAVDGLELLNLLPDEGHDADAAEDVLTAQT